MRLAFAINDLSGGGAEKALKLLTGFLAGEGVEARVFTLQSGNDSYELDPGVDRVTLGSARITRGVGKILGLPLQAAELARHLAEWQPDLCVSFLPRSNIAHVMTRWFGNRRPVLLTEQVSSRNAYSSNGPGDRLMRAMIRNFYPQADAVFPSSEGVKQGLTGFGVAPEAMHVVYNAISCREIQESARRPVHGADFGTVPTVITVGRHAAQKDHETLLRAFSLVRGRLESRLVLIGQGPLRGALENLAQDLEIEDSVVFAGWQGNPFAWMGRADLFVLSSRFEGFGNVIVEAMACGLPIVSTDCPSGPSEILQGGDSGVLVPVGDVEALAAAMESVLADRTVRDDLAARSRIRAPDFDISVIGPRYLSLLRSYSNLRTGTLV